MFLWLKTNSYENLKFYVRHFFYGQYGSISKLLKNNFWILEGFTSTLLWMQKLKTGSKLAVTWRT